MVKPELKESIIKIIVNLIGKKDPKTLNSLLELYEKITNRATILEARIKDLECILVGKNKIYKTTDIQYGRLIKKHNIIVKDSNKRIANLTTENKRYKRKSVKYKMWMDKKFKKWKKKKEKRLKSMKIKIKKGL